MGLNGKHRWRFPLHRSSSSSAAAGKLPAAEPPKELLCPLSGSLMADPVVVSSGQTFERVFVQACLDLGLSPRLPDGSALDFSTVIPNIALRSTVIRWCRDSGVECPKPPDYLSAEKLLRTMAPAPGGKSSGDAARTERSVEGNRVSEAELLQGVTGKPPVLMSHAATELNHRRRSSQFDSSSDESVIIGSPATPLPLATRPSCYSSTSSSSDIVAEETTTLNPGSLEEEKILAKLSHQDVFEQEQGAISLRKVTRTDEEIRVSLCTPRLLLALKPLLSSRYAVLQTNVVAALVNVSLEKLNKVKIVRSGIVPPLIDVLKGGCAESQEHAAGALFSLALEDDNKTALGVLGALQPLLHALRSDSERARHDAALALYHLSLVQSNRMKLVKLGAVPTLLTIAAGSGPMAGRVLLTLCNLAACGDGRSAMLDANAVELLVVMLREGAGAGESESESAAVDNCVAALYSLSHGSMRFKGLAKEARAAEVLREVEERGSGRSREKAKRMLQLLKGRDLTAGFDGVLESAAVGRAAAGGGARSSEF